MLAGAPLQAVVALNQGDTGTTPGLIVGLVASLGMFAYHGYRTYAIKDPDADWPGPKVRALPKGGLDPPALPPGPA